MSPAPAVGHPRAPGTGGGTLRALLSVTRAPRQLRGAAGGVRTWAGGRGSSAGFGGLPGGCLLLGWGATPPAPAHRGGPGLHSPPVLGRGHPRGHLGAPGPAHLPHPPPPGQVSGAQSPCQGGRQDPPAAAEPGAPPAQPPCPGGVSSAATVLPAPGPCPEPLPDRAAAAPRPSEGNRPLAGRPPLGPARPAAPRAPPGRADPPGRPEQGQLSLLSPPGVAEGSGAAGARSHVPAPPPPSCTSLTAVQPEGPPRSPAGQREAPGTVPGVPRFGPVRPPERWVRPQVEVLDPGAELKAPARPPAARRRGRGPGLPREPGTAWGTQLQPAPPNSPQPLSPLPRPLGSLLDPARLVPGVTVRRAGSVRRGRGIPGEEEEEEAKRDLRPIRPPGPFPATAARQLPGDAQC